MIITIVFAFNDGQESFIASVWLLNFLKVLIFTIISVLVFAIGQKAVANIYGATAEIRIWFLKKIPLGRGIGHMALNKVPLGAIIPILITLLTNGLTYIATVMQTVIESKPVKRVARKWKTISDFEYAKVMLSGPLAVIILAYIIKALNISGNFLLISTLIAVFTIIPLPKLNGGELFMHSRPLFGFGFSFIIASAILLLLITGTLLILLLSILIALLAGILVYYYIYK